MAAGAKILASLSDDAVRWIESLSRKLGDAYTNTIPTDPEYLADEMGEKLVNLTREAPQMLDIYKDKGLYEVLREANFGESDLGLIKPSTFRESAAPINTNDPHIRDMVDEKVRKLIDLRESGTGYHTVPFLSVKEYGDGELISKVVGHEGRHRSRALESLGEPDQLVRFIRRSSESLPDLPPQTKLYSEKVGSSLDEFVPEDKPVGTLSELIKFLSVMPPAALGALSQLPEEADAK
tara:strand:- start:33 stop:743 length:711 start_codon:yes stop_codon:yes gene_type:complete